MKKYPADGNSIHFFHGSTSKSKSMAHFNHGVPDTMHEIEIALLCCPRAPWTVELLLPLWGWNLGQTKVAYS